MFSVLLLLQECSTGQLKLPFLNRIKWLQLDPDIVELERILGKYQLSCLLVHIAIQRLNDKPGVTQPVGVLGYVSKQMSSGFAFSPVWGAMLTINDSCYP